MSTLKYILEYHCYPIWHYNANGELIDNDLPDELRHDEELDTLLLNVQEMFDNLYVDTPKAFLSQNFLTESERQNFLNLLFLSVDLIKRRYGKKYVIECQYTFDSFLPVKKIKNL